RRPADRVGQGYLLTEAGLLQAALKIPVIGVGGIEEGAFIDESLRQRRLSLAAVGRAILKGPETWRERNLTRSALSSRCLRSTPSGHAPQPPVPQERPGPSPA